MRPLSQADLIARGWLVLTEADVCWLDCARPANMARKQGDRLIVLCPQHCLILEAGRWKDDYSAAPLPADSLAVSWPWWTEQDEAA